MSWKDNFKAYTMQMNFHIGMSRPMMEFICAVADDVEWDRFNHGMGTGPYNPIASSKSLEKRGLIEKKKHGRPRWDGANVYEIRSLWSLTPAGKLVVELLKITGLFVESDNAIERKSLRAAK